MATTKEKKRTIITDKSKNGEHFKAGPAPSRDLFIFRVDKSSSDQEIKAHIQNCGFTVRNLECVSNPDAKYKSLKLSVPAPEFEKLFDDKIWPDGVRVRKFIPPRS